jgi:glycine cleavage system H protein
MGKVPADCRYTKEHEWLREEGQGQIRIGITDYAQQELGDVVFVDLPEIGKALKKGQAVCAVESVKAVSDAYAPVDGSVVEVNTALNDSPQLLNESAYEQGWIAVLRIDNATQLAELLSADDYEKYLSEISK